MGYTRPQSSDRFSFTITKGKNVMVARISDLSINTRGSSYVSAVINAGSTAILMAALCLTGGCSRNVDQKERGEPVAAAVGSTNALQRLQEQRILQSICVNQAVRTATTRASAKVTSWEELPPTGTPPARTVLQESIEFGALAGATVDAELTFQFDTLGTIEIKNGFGIRRTRNPTPPLRTPRITLLTPSMLTSESRVPAMNTLTTPIIVTPIPDTRYLVVHTPTRDYVFVAQVPNKVTVAAGNATVDISQCQYAILDASVNPPSWLAPQPLPAEGGAGPIEVMAILSHVKATTGQSFFSGGCGEEE
jgi:hypothetical protein